MLRWLHLLACVAVTGCATGGVRNANSSQFASHARAVEVAADDSAAITASALVFAPRVVGGEWVPDLSRADRQPSAFVGFDGPVVEYYHIETYDRQISGSGNWSYGGWGYGYGGGDRYERRAYIDKIGVLYR